MKAILEFNLPEDEAEHKYALAGLDALLLIHNLEQEIRQLLRHGGGEFQEWRNEEGEVFKGCPKTLARVRQWILAEKQERLLPELH